MNDYSSALQDIILASKGFKVNSANNYDAAIIMPPPNVTGNLHIGHALNLFLQDIVVRSEKLFHNRRILWIPGSDHAGIATQLLVQKKLSQEGIVCQNKDELVQHIWRWKEVYEKNIINQIKKLGVRVNWDHYVFTLDPLPQKGVVEAFCRLNERGLIFRSNKILNWDIELQSVISDIESTSKELEATLYYITYTADDGDQIVVATVRPETIFADEAIAVHPDDDRYKKYHGKYFHVPLTAKKIPIIADYACEIDKGTGAVKIDPAHGFADFDVALRHGLKVEAIIDKHGKMCGNVPDWVAGLDRFAARKVVAEKLIESGVVSKIEKTKNLVPHGTRSNCILEPMVLDQWFLDMPELQQRAREIIEEIELLPENFKDIYLEYVNNLQPWCISRQISWGHRIPAWYDQSGQVYIARSLEEAQQKAGTTNLAQDEDVLDTWFSSSLWPMLTLGWPEERIEMRFYPNECLITGHDILFFWATKMIIMHIGLFGNSGAPFKSIKLHGLVQDESGMKMSKSKNNVVEPIALCDEYGTDVVSFALISTAKTGQNIKFGAQNIHKSKKFLNKFWNAMNFCLKNMSRDTVEVSNDFNLYIIMRFAEIEQNVAKKIREWDVYGAADAVYHFFWDDFCSWHLEVSKCLNSNESRYSLFIMFKNILKLMHPFLPVVTEYFWQKISEKPDIFENFTEDPQSLPENNFADILKLRRITKKIRSIRDKFQLNYSSLIFIRDDFEAEKLMILNAITGLNIQKSTKKEGLLLSIEAVEFWILLEYAPEDTMMKIDKILQNIQKDILILSKQLSDDGFLNHASQELVSEKKNTLEDLQIDYQIFANSLQSLKNMG